MSQGIGSVVPGYSALTQLMGKGMGALGRAYAKEQNQASQGVGTKTAQGVQAKDSVSTGDLKVDAPKDSKTEKVIDKANTVLTVVTTASATAGTLLAPLSMAGGFWSLARAQNVKGREAHFKAMAIDGAIDYMSTGNGKTLPALSGFPTVTEAAVGQGCLGQTASLNSVFHNSRERGIFTNQYNKTMGTLKRLYQTPQGRAQLKDMVIKYKAFKRANPSTPAHTFFLQDK